MQPIFEMSRGQKIYLILRTTKMGGNCMVNNICEMVKVLQYYTQRDNIQVSTLWLSKVLLQVSWMRKS